MARVAESVWEWPGNATDRFRATPEALEGASDDGAGLRYAQLPAHDPATAFPPTTAPGFDGACTHVMVHKRRDGACTLLLNGQVSTPDAKGEHVLPDFREDQLVKEDSTQREVPAPVLVSMLVEEGACEPNGVMLQVMQRTYVGGVQLNEAREIVAMETQVPVTRPGDALARTLAVGYPMAVAPAPSLTFFNWDRQRADNSNVLRTVTGVEANWGFRQTVNWAIGNSRIISPDEATISVFELVPTLKRLAYATSKLTFEDLKEAGRRDDIFVLKYLVYSPGDQEALDNDVRDLWDYFEERGMDWDSLKNSGYTETAFRVEVVDSGGESVRRTFPLVSKCTWGAGYFGAGYRELLADCRASRNLFQLDGGGATLGATPQGATRRPMQALFRKFCLARSVAVPSIDQLNFRANRLVDVVIARLQALQTALVPRSPTPLDGTRASLWRSLPHVVSMRNMAGLSLVMEGDEEAISIATSTTPNAKVGDRLQDAVAASAATLRVVRQAVKQFIEVEGANRDRARLQLCLDDAQRAAALEPLRSGAVGTRLRPLGELPTPGQLGTRHIYAPRLPREVVAALTCRAEHVRIEEEQFIRWLTALDGRDARDGMDVVGLMASFGLPPSHVGELVLGAMADLAVDDVLDRIGADLTYRAMRRRHLMAPSINVAVRRLKRAAALAKVVYRDALLKVRLAENDPFFECYPEGNTLRKLLNESATWREWEIPPRPGALVKARFDRHAEVAMATPMGVKAVGELLDALVGLRASATVPLAQLPFLPAQTLTWYAPSNPMLTSGSATRDALVLQLTHAYASAQRIQNMAAGLRLVDADRAAVLRECAWARPVLQLAASTTVNLSRSNLDTPIAGTSEAQRALALAPTDRTLVNNLDAKAHQGLRERRASMRVDLAAFEDDEAADDLLNAFSRIRLQDAAEHHVPFGASMPGELVPRASRRVEDLPVHVGELLDTTERMATYTNAQVVRIEARLAHDTKADTHPLVITWERDGNEENGERVSASFAFPRRVAQRDVTGVVQDVPATLRDAFLHAKAVHEQLPFAHCVGVDAANAMLFNVERLVQCGLLLASTSRDDTYADAEPPPWPRRLTVPIPKLPTVPPLLVHAQQRVLLIGALLSFWQGVDQQGKPEFEAWLLNTLRQLVDATSAPGQEAELQQNLVGKSVDIVGTDSDGIADYLNAVISALGALDGVADRAAYAINTRQPTAGNLLATDLTVQDALTRTAALVESLTRQQAPIGNLAAAARDAYRVEYNYYKGALDRAQQKADRARQDAEALRAAAEAEDAALEAEKIRQETFHKCLWSLTVRVANAVLRAMLRKPPLLRATPVDAPVHDAEWARAIAAWERSLSVVPLGELCACAVRAQCP